MKMNSDKCHLFIYRNKFLNLWAKIGNDKIWESRTVKLLAINLGNEFSFDEHLNNVCLKAKVVYIIENKKYLESNKMKVLFKAFFES